MKHNYHRYGLFTWPESQEFVGRDDCILVNPPEEDEGCTLDSAYLVPITEPDDDEEAYARIPWPESQKWLDKETDELDDVLRDYDTQDAYVRESLLDEQSDKPLRKFEVTLYYHTNVTITVEAEDEESAEDIAREKACDDEYTKQLLEGLQEDDSPDVEEI